MDEVSSDLAPGSKLIKFTVVVSYYAARNSFSLLRLVDSLVAYSCQLTVVVNTDFPISLPKENRRVKFVQHRNVGMNIGAWNRGFIEDCESDYYLFLQDECFLRRADFVDYICNRFRCEENLGMLGESLNERWAFPWENLQASALNHSEEDHFIEGVKARRVDTYLYAIRKWGVNPGTTAEHLRSLVWAFPGEVLRKLGGFPIGNNKGECIAAEISVSRKVADMGLKFDQFTAQPFAFFGHTEWRPDGKSKVR